MYFPRTRKRLRLTLSFVPISPDQGVAFRPAITVPSRACLFLRGCVFFALNVQNLVVINDFRSGMPVTSEKSFGISHRRCGMVIAEPSSDRHETAGVRPQL